MVIISELLLAGFKPTTSWYQYRFFTTKSQYTLRQCRPTRTITRLQYTSLLTHATTQQTASERHTDLTKPNKVSVAICRCSMNWSLYVGINQSSLLRLKLVENATAHCLSLTSLVKYKKKKIDWFQDYLYLKLCMELPLFIFWISFVFVLLKELLDPPLSCY